MEEREDAIEIDISENGANENETNSNGANETNGDVFRNVFLVPKFNESIV